MELRVKYQHGAGSVLDIVFQPYLYGDDKMQHTFIWGSLSNQGGIYKLMLQNIEAVELTSTRFEIDKKACYYYSLEQEFWSIAPDFDQQNQIWTGSHIGE